MSETLHVRAELDDMGVLTISLDRPDKRNAQTPEMLGALARHVRDARDARDARAILLRGDGRVFCAGFDLPACVEDDSVLLALLDALSAAVGALRAAEAPVVIAAHGAAIAGGCALLAGGDVVIADAGATLGYPVARLGVSPAVNASFLRAGLGDGPARNLMLRGGVIGADEALRLGLVHEVAPSAAETLDRAMGVARSWASGVGRATVELRALLNQQSRVTPTGVSRGLRVSRDLAESGAHRERLAAWVARKR